MHEYGLNQAQTTPAPCNRRNSSSPFGEGRTSLQGTTTMTAGIPPGMAPGPSAELFSMQQGFAPDTRGQGAPPVTEANYIPGYLASMIGKNVKAEFVVGTNQYVEKTGVLLDVGVNYFILLDSNTRTTIMCDLYSVKFVTVVYA